MSKPPPFWRSERHGRENPAPVIIDVTLPIETGGLSWPGDPVVEIERVLAVSTGDPANVSALRLGSHTGTHVDAPSHLRDGATSIDEILLDALCGPAVVVDLRGRPGPLTAEDLNASVPQDVERMLLLTDNSERWPEHLEEFPSDYVALSVDAAAWCVERGLTLVGIDFLSVEVFEAPGHPTHRTLLDGEVVIVEGLDLRGVAPGSYDLVVAPLKLRGCDGSPARVFLRH